MLTCASPETPKSEIISVDNQSLLKTATWIDLVFPTKEEAQWVESCLGFRIPNRAEMVEIELSSRLYMEQGRLYMTATMIAKSESDEPQLDPVTFILTGTQLITIRYIEPLAFKLFALMIQKTEPDQRDAGMLFADLLDATIDRLADILEFLGHRLDACSKSIFRPKQERTSKINYPLLMQEIGSMEDLNTKAQESLVTFNRLVVFYSQSSLFHREAQDASRLTTMSRDIAALSDHAHFLSTKINFLLDSTLGLVNIEQSNIIKIFSVAAVIFLPPTLIASVYGMNFPIPELTWRYGYYIALGLMMFAAWLPYKYFKYRKWL